MDDTLYINGYAVDCALGKDPGEVAERLFADDPEVSIRRHPELDIPFFTMDGYDGRGFIHSAAFAVCHDAARDALAMAFPETGVPPRELKVGCVVGTTGDVQFGDLEFYKALKAGLPPDDKIRDFTSGTIAERLVRKYGFSGPALTISNTCVSGADAVLLGALWIESGLCDAVIALGVDLTTLMCLAGFRTLGAASAERCRPFDAARSGMNVGEGCGCVVLRRGGLPEAVERSWATPEFKFLGGGSSCDAYHLTAPHPEGLGLQQAIRKALAMSGVSPRDIAFVNAHGTGTLANDACEAKALKAIFGGEIPFFSTKGLTGHTLGASGVLELIFTMLCLKARRIPASFGCADPAPDLPMAPNLRPREISGSVAMSTSLAFGGYNTALIVERMDHVSA